MILLVGGLEHQFYFPIYIGLLIIPIDELIFFRGVALAHQPVYHIGHALCSHDFPMVFYSHSSQAFGHWQRHGACGDARRPCTGVQVFSGSRSAVKLSDEFGDCL